MTKIVIAFVALCIFTAILQADEKNANTRPKTMEKSLTLVPLYSTDQTESSFTKTA